MKPRLRRLVARSLERSVARLITHNPDLIVVAVGGSLGKTSTKTAIATILREKYRVLVHEGNYNSELGLPLAIFELDVPAKITDVGAWVKLLGTARKKSTAAFAYDVMVLELGTDHPGEMARFMTYLKPNIGVVTAIAPEHMEYFKTLEAVADEEFILAQGSQIACINETFPELVRRASALTSRVIRYGGEQTVVGAKVVGAHSLQPLMAAVAVARQLGLSDELITAGVSKYTGVPGRMQRFEGLNGSQIIDDTYNAAPDSVLAALAVLNEAKGRHIAILGSMNELGANSPQYHEQVGAACGKLDLLLTIGRDAGDHLGPAAVRAGLPADRWHAFTSPYEAGKWLAPQLAKGDWVLAKGSQNGVFAEEAIKQLLAHPKDAARLVRQSPEWAARKAAQFKVQ